MLTNLVKLNTDKGPAFVSSDHIIAIGAAFKARPKGRPKSRVKADEAPPEVGPEVFRRALFLVGGGVLYITDEVENLRALGLE